MAGNSNKGSGRARREARRAAREAEKKAAEQGLLGRITDNRLVQTFTGLSATKQFGIVAGGVCISVAFGWYGYVANNQPANAYCLMPHIDSEQSGTQLLMEAKTGVATFQNNILQMALAVEALNRGLAKLRDGNTGDLIKIQRGAFGLYGTLVGDFDQGDIRHVIEVDPTKPNPSKTMVEELLRVESGTEYLQSHGMTFNGQPMTVGHTDWFEIAGGSNVAIGGYKLDLANVLVEWKSDEGAKVSIKPDGIRITRTVDMHACPARLKIYGLN